MVAVIDNHDEVSPGAEHERVVEDLDVWHIRADPGRIAELVGV